MGGSTDDPVRGVYAWRVLAVLILLLLCVPFAELIVIVVVSGSLGVWETIGLMILVSLVGAWMVRRSGLAVLRQVQLRLSEGEIPGRELVDGVLILVAGAFMLTPGFLTDAVGLLLLFPPSRILVRTYLMRRFKSRAVAAGWSGGSGGWPGGSGGWHHPGHGDVVDAQEAPHRQAPGDSPEIGGPK